jgi:hypothetical protein
VWLGHSALRHSWGTLHPRFDIAAQAVSLLQHGLPALEMLRISLSGPPNPLDAAQRLRYSRTLCEIGKILKKFKIRLKK